MGNEIEQIAQQNEMSIEFVTWFFNEKKVGCGNVWFMMMAAMWEGWKGRSIEMNKLAAERNAALNAERVWEKTMMEVCGEDGPVSVAAVIKALAVENVALKNVFIQKEIPSEAVDAFLETAVMDHDWNETSEWSWVENETEVIHAVLDVLKPETPATDAYLAGIKADVITASLDACSDYLETDCVMDRLDISYEEAEKRTSGAIEFHDAIVAFVNQQREGTK
ncbi:hypothetical protein ACOIE4_003675 [Klebsiella variicola]|uniref:hypothetical protein n=1 Tax=Klebsiella TaxID=570 RepID=UPI000DE72E06|nr:MULTISPECIES: hypothetical protein [Klebsiella]MEB5936399.1 hypothetical protein [Klebsiella pneumoniae]SSK09364.1 Uncharacterised protein [Klebsiella pneumoniae]SWQ00141.1 Uncharacterised protein [Klebsiella pneumoniae]SXF61652.1 Uncharacterised protein [Klebsiella variicola]